MRFDPLFFFYSYFPLCGMGRPRVTACAAGMSLFFIRNVRKTGSGFTPGHKPFDDVIKS